VVNLNFWPAWKRLISVQLGLLSIEQKIIQYICIHCWRINATIHIWLISVLVTHTNCIYYYLGGWVRRCCLILSIYILYIYIYIYIYVSVNNVYVYVICMYICIYIYIFLLNLGVHPPFSDSPKGITLRLPGEGLDVNEGATPPSGGCGMRLDPNT